MTSAGKTPQNQNRPERRLISPELALQFKRLIDQKRAADGLPPRYGDPATPDHAPLPPAAPLPPEHPLLAPLPPRRDEIAGGLKLYPELGRLADATGEDRLLRVWYGLRFLDQQGQGWLADNRATRAALIDLGVAPSKQTLRKLLKRGDGVWWHLGGAHGGGKTLAIAGLRAISLYVVRKARAAGIPDVDRAPGRPLELSVRALTGSLTRWRATLFQIWIAAGRRNQRRIDWATLEACWNRGRTTLRARLKLARVKVIHNFACIPLSAYAPDSPYPFGKLPLVEGASVTTLDGVPCLLFQRPNTYRAWGRRAPKGMSKKVHQAVKHALDIPPRAYAPRQYFDDPLAFGKSRNRNFDLEHYHLSRKRAWGRFWRVHPAFI